MSHVTGTWAGSRPAEELLPAEYARVVGQLKKRGEKGHMILALNEVRERRSGCAPVRVAAADGWQRSSWCLARHDTCRVWWVW
jgi:hypothetical protein